MCNHHLIDLLTMYRLPSHGVSSFFAKASCKVLWLLCQIQSSKFSYIFRELNLTSKSNINVVYSGSSTPLRLTFLSPILIGLPQKFHETSYLTSPAFCESSNASLHSTSHLRAVLFCTFSVQHVFIFEGLLQTQLDNSH